MSQKFETHTEPHRLYHFCTSLRYYQQENPLRWCLGRYL